MKTLIISPTYNEKKNIQSLVKKVLKPNKNYDLLIIDDNSPDGTSDMVQELQKDYDNLYLHQFSLTCNVDNIRKPLWHQHHIFEQFHQSHHKQKLKLFF